MQSDIEIAQAAQPQRIDAIAEKAGIDDKYLEMYGKYKAKVDYNLLRDNEHTPGKDVYKRQTYSRPDLGLHDA